LTIFLFKTKKSIQLSTIHRGVMKFATKISTLLNLNYLRMFRNQGHYVPNTIYTNFDILCAWERGKEQIN
jgi:hypothetical protein